MSTVETLKKARSLISGPGRWVRAWGVKDGDGEMAYCAVGAVKVAAGLHYSPTGRNTANEESKAAVAALAKVVGGSRRGDVVEYNDSHDQDCVLKMFDAAIEAEKAKEASSDAA